MEERDGFRQKAEKIISKLNKRNIEGFYCENGKKACELLAELVPDGASAGWGGSVTLEQIHLKELLEKKGCCLYDMGGRDADPKKAGEMYRKSVGADYFFMSVNGITEEGELVNIDGAGTRLSRMIYGPEHVIMVVGKNKISPDIQTAIDRIRNQVCPVMAVKGNRKTPCASLGRCGDCFGADCMCCEVVITRKSRQNGRMKLILVGEDLGY